MNQTVHGEQWVWVIVQDPGANEQFLGQYDEEKKESFIPVFLEKEEAQQALEKMAYEPGCKYEAQAIQFEDLKGRAAESGFMVFVLRASGEVLEKFPEERR